MIKSLSLRNFKCFRHLKIQLTNLNVFAGVNGTGKSTVVQSLLAVRQSWDSGNLGNGRLQLNGAIVELGTAREVYCADPSDEFVELAFQSSALNGDLKLTSRQTESPFDEYSFHIEDELSPLLGEFELFQEPFNYLHAERIGPRKAFPIPPDEGHPLRVGRFGENAPFLVASERRNTAIGNNSLLLSGSENGTVYPKLQYQLPLWMARLFPGFQSESEIYSAADQVRLGLALRAKQTGQGLFVRPTNTGFGVSFVLGIVVAGLVAQPNTILIVENPEAHLHPRAQSTIGEFLARVAAGNVQVFIETHSEHVLNGMRRMVREKILAPEDIGIRIDRQITSRLGWIELRRL